MSLGQIAADHYDRVKENLLFISLVLALVIALVIIVFQEFGFRVFRRKKSATTTTP